MQRKRIGFTLVEILVSILILGVVKSAVMTLFFSFFESYQFHQDISEAKQRGISPLLPYSPFVSGAALGFRRGKRISRTFSAKPPLFLLDDVSPNKKFSGRFSLHRDVVYLMTPRGYGSLACVRRASGLVWKRITKRIPRPGDRADA